MENQAQYHSAQINRINFTLNLQRERRDKLERALGSCEAAIEQLEASLKYWQNKAGNPAKPKRKKRIKKSKPL